jgi:hypothetical protein
MQRGTGRAVRRNMQAKDEGQSALKAYVHAMPHTTKQ